MPPRPPLPGRPAGSPSYPAGRAARAPLPLPVPAPGFEHGALVVDGRDGARRLRFVPTRAERAFRTAVAALGAAAFGIGLGQSGAPSGTSPEGVVALGLGVVLTLLGIGLARIGGTVTLDGSRGELRRRGGLLGNGTRERLAFAEVALVERLAYRVGDGDTARTAYQVNLVARDGRRAHVHAHSDRVRAERTARAVAELVGAPLRRVGTPSRTEERVPLASRSGDARH